MFESQPSQIFISADPARVLEVDNNKPLQRWQQYMSSTRSCDLQSSNLKKRLLPSATGCDQCKLRLSTCRTHLAQLILPILTRHIPYTHRLDAILIPM